MKKSISKITLRVHAFFLIALTIMNIILSLMATYKGVGPMKFLHDYPIAEVGLIQAYMLMLVIGVILWMGSYQQKSWRYDLIGIVAHIIPLFALIVFWDTIVEFMPGVTTASMLIHTIWITLELIAAITQYRIDYQKS